MVVCKTWATPSRLDQESGVHVDGNGSLYCFLGKIFQSGHRLCGVRVCISVQILKKERKERVREIWVLQNTFERLRYALHTGGRTRARSALKIF